MFIWAQEVTVCKRRAKRSHFAFCSYFFRNAFLLYSKSSWFISLVILACLCNMALIEILQVSWQDISRVWGHIYLLSSMEMFLCVIPCRWEHNFVFPNVEFFFGTEGEGQNWKPSNHKKSLDFSGRKKSSASLPSEGEVNPSVPCRRFTACKRSLNVTWKVGIFRQNSSAISRLCSSTFGC